MIRRTFSGSNCQNLTFPALACLFVAAACSARAEIVPGEVVVRMKPTGTLARPLAFRDQVGVATSYLPQLQVYRVKLFPGVNEANALAKLQSRPDVLYAHPLRRLHAVATPNDPKYGTNQYGPQKIQADKAWDLYQPKAQKIVAIVDTGVSYTHADLVNVLLKDANQTVIGWNAQTSTPNAQDDHGHGTHCAGVAAAEINNSTGIAGIAGWNPNVQNSTTYVKVMPVKVLDSTGSGTDVDVANGIVWATDHGANIISMSLGDTQTTQTLNDAVKYAWDHGLLVAAAAGNNGSSSLFYPAACDNVVSVGATDSNDKLTYFSNYGGWVKVAAPGDNIYSTYYNGGYAIMSGTSMATPHVAGEAALLWAHAPTLTNAQISAVIQGNTDTYTPYNGHTIAAGSGRINVFKAIQSMNLPPAPPAAPTNLTATGGNGQVALAWTASSTATSYNVKRFTSSGGPYANIATGVTATTYTDTGVTNGTKYYYVVSAVNLGGESAVSNEASATPSAPVSSASAVFLNLDTTTHGSWKGVYGSEGYAISQLSGGTSLPPYAQWSVTGNSNYTWNASTTDVRALQKVATSDRIASCWYGGTYTASLNLTDGQAHRVALYVLDWDSTSRAEKVDVLDATTSQVLNSQPVSSFNGGKWLVWSISGNVKIRVTYTAGANAVLSGVFFDTPGGQPPAPPAPPANLTATAGNAQVALSWTASSGATGYNVKRSTTAGGPYNTSVATGLTTTTCTDTSVTNGTKYYYVVTSTGTGGESGNSNEASATPLPPAPTSPTNLVATAGDSQVSLTWTASSGATTYTLKRGVAPGGPYSTTVATGITTTNYTNTGLTNGTKYYFVVTAVNLGGESANSNEASATPLPPVPAAPTNLTATPGNAQVALSWTASSGATSYTVKRSATSGGPYSNVVTGVSTASYTDTGVANGTKYFYVVTAVNLGGESGSSNEASATPSAPTGGNSAVFLNLDSTTKGSWKGVYGSEGYAIAQLSGGTSLPAYAQWSVTSSNWTWSASTTDARALQKVAASDRIAACWYGGAYTASLNLTDGQAHQVALYVLDWDSNSRAERIDVLDAATNLVLNSQTVSSFNGGKWLVWSITGNVKFRVTYTGGANGVISGVFFK